ncbi:hypothetical protein WI44_19470 [Burkholderia cepacia]|nr:hypothetical protein WI44_19470 [Burkholderia cepacia]KVA42168.1 hypothetical protein WI45_17750 [Burkholderia cepacia]
MQLNSPNIHSPLLCELAFLKGAGKRGPRSTEFEIEQMTWMANNLQSSTHDLPTRMPEVDHPQNLPMS